MRRRDLIKGIAGSATAWPFTASAQQRERMRRVGVLTPFPADDVEGQTRVTAFAQALQQAGWTLGQNLRLDYRWGDGKPDTMRKYATELAALSAGRYSGQFQRIGIGPAGGDPHRSDRVRGCSRSGRRRLCREPGAAGR